MCALLCNMKDVFQCSWLSLMPLFHLKIQGGELSVEFLLSIILVPRWFIKKHQWTNMWKLTEMLISMLRFLLFYPIQKTQRTHQCIFSQPLSLFCLLLTWPQEEVYQSRHGWRLQGIWVCGLEDMARQWKGRRGRWSRMSKHWTSRDLLPPSQFLEHWEKTWLLFRQHEILHSCSSSDSKATGFAVWF